MRRVLDAMTDAMTHRGPDDRGTFTGPGCRAWRAAAVDRRRGGWPPAGRRTRTVRSSAVQNGELYNHRRAAATSCDATAIASASRCDTESCRTSTSSTATAFAERLRGKFGDRGLGRAAATRGARTRPARRQAALLGAPSATSSSSPPSSRACSPAAWSARRARLRGDRRLPHARLRSRARTRRSRASEAPARPPARRRARTASAIEPYWRYPHPAPEHPPRHRRVRRTSCSSARGIRPAAPDERRAARRDALRRPRLQPDRRADGRAT